MTMILMRQFLNKAIVAHHSSAEQEEPASNPLIPYIT